MEIRKAMVAWREARGPSSLVEIENFLGGSAPSSKYMLGWMNSLLGNVNYPFFMVLYKISMNNLDVMYVLIERYAIFVYNHCCLCLSSQMEKSEQ